LAARLTRHEVIEFPELYLEVMVDVISATGAPLTKSLVTHPSSIFVCAVACDDHAAKALACGLAMQLGDDRRQPASLRRKALAELRKWGSASIREG